jgi:plastocyanin
MRVRTISALSMALVLTLTTSAARAQYDDPVGGDGDAPEGCVGVQATVLLEAGTLTFNPFRIVVAPGNAVCWTWSGMPHTVKADDGSFSSGPPRPSGSFKRTFPAAGTFGYHCQVHGSPQGGMRGEVVVQGGDEPPPSGPGTLQVAAATLTVAETAGNAEVVVERAGGSDGKATVLYSTAPGTAKNNSDFKPLKNKLLTWQPGELGPKTVLVGLKNDKAKEQTETFSLVLTKPIGASLGTSVTAVSLTDDDSPACPAAPAALALRATGQSPSEIRLDWPAHAAPEGLLRIERGRADGAFEEIAAVSAALGEYVDSSLPADSSRFYRLRFEDESYSDAVVASTDGSTSGCAPANGALCLANGRFEVTALWRRDGAPRRAARPAPLADSRDAGLFNLADNGPALLVGIDATCATNDHYGVSLAAVAEAEFTVRVRDTVTGRVWTRLVPAGGPSALRDPDAFATCP